MTNRKSISLVVVLCLFANAGTVWANPFQIAGQRRASEAKQSTQAANSPSSESSATPASVPESIAQPSSAAIPLPLAHPLSAKRQPCTWQTQQIADKLGRGAGNLLSGWMEIPLQIGKRSASSNDKATGFFSGAVIGIGKALQRTVVGAFEIVTFPFPFEGKQPILPTLDYYDRSKERQRLPLE